MILRCRTWRKEMKPSSSRRGRVHAASHVFKCSLVSQKHANVYLVASNLELWSRMKINQRLRNVCCVDVSRAF